MRITCTIDAHARNKLERAQAVLLEAQVAVAAEKFNVDSQALTEATEQRQALKDADPPE